MPTESQTPSAAPVAPKTRREIAALWHDAKTDADKKALVAQYPELRAMYSEAQNY